MNIYKKVCNRVAVCLLLLASSCNYLPCGWDDDLSQVSTIPIEQTIIGQYIPDEITKEIIPGYKISPAQIILENDGIMKFQNIPGSTFDFEKYYSNNHEPISGSGNWQVDNKENKIELDVKLKFQPNTLSNYGTSYRLYKKNGKYVIFIIVGDPDECSAARFIQQ